VHGSNARNLSVYPSLPQTSKNTVFLIVSYVFSSTKLENKRVEQVLPRKGGDGMSGEVAQTMYTHVSKCKNDKIKERKKKMHILSSASCL
jgi:hypothetical protein